MPGPGNKSEEFEYEDEDVVQEADESLTEGTEDTDDVEDGDVEELDLEPSDDTSGYADEEPEAEDDYVEDDDSLADNDPISVSDLNVDETAGEEGEM